MDHPNKRFIVAFSVFVIVSYLLFKATGGLESFVISGLVALLAFAVYGAERSKTSERTTEHGKVTFSWRGIDVYGDQGVFRAYGREYDISEVQKISYQTTGNRGCLGGDGYIIHLHMNDIETPRITLRQRNFTSNGNLETEADFERLGIALKCTG